MSLDLTASLLTTRKLKTQLAQSQLKYEQLSDRYVKLEHEYGRLRSQQPTDILERFDKEQQGRIQQYEREILTLKNQITQMNRLVIGDNNETVWSIKQQLKVAVGERTASKRDQIQQEELLRQYKWKIETIQQEKDSLVNLNRELEARAQKLQHEIELQNETIQGYVAEFDHIEEIMQDSQADITPQQAVTELIEERDRLKKSVEEYEMTSQDDRSRLEDAERSVADLETAVQQLNFELAEAKSRHLAQDQAVLEKDRRIERLEGELAMLKETQETLRSRVLQSYDEQKYKELDEKLINVTRRAGALDRENEELREQIQIYSANGQPEVQNIIDQLRQQHQMAIGALSVENDKLAQKVQNLEKIGGGTGAMQARVDQHLAELESENELLKAQVQKGLELASKLNQQLQAKPKDSAEVKSEILLKNAQIQQLQQQLELAREDVKDFTEKEQALRQTLQNYQLSSNEDEELIEQQRQRIENLFEENEMYEDKLIEQVKSNEALYAQYEQLINRSSEQLLLQQSALDRSGISFARTDSRVGQPAEQETLEVEDITMNVMAHDEKVMDASESEQVVQSQLPELQVVQTQKYEAVPAKSEVSASDTGEKQRTVEVSSVPEPLSPIVTEEETVSTADAPKKKKRSSAKAEGSNADAPESKVEEPLTESLMEPPAEPSTDKAPGAKKKKKSSTATTAETSKAEEAPKPPEAADAVPKAEAAETSASAATGEKKKKKKSSTASAEVSKADDPPSAPVAAAPAEAPKAETSADGAGEKKKKKKSSTASAEISKADEPAPPAEEPKAETSVDGAGEKKKKKKSTTTASAEISKADEPAKPAEPSDASVGEVKKKKKKAE